MSLDQRATIYLVDDDLEIRALLTQIVTTAGWPTKSFASANDFLAAYVDNEPTCLVTDLHMASISGLELIATLRAHEYRLPVILISGDISIADTVRAMQYGATTVLPKPFEDHQLLCSIAEAVEYSQLSWRKDHEWRIGVGQLSPREREVANHLLHGKTIKEIGRSLAISSSTVDKHRQQLFAKLRVDSPAELLLKASHSRRIRSIDSKPAT